MSRGPAFIDRDVFEQTIASIRAANGSWYNDIGTIYGDLSRLVVAWAASMSPEEIIRTYTDLGWGGTANGRAIHESAKQWLRTYHPDRLGLLEGRRTSGA